MTVANGRLRLHPDQQRAIAGMFEGFAGDDVQIRPYVNKGGGILERWTVGTPATVDNSTRYTITIPDMVAVSFTTDASATRAELVAGLVAAWGENAVANSFLDVVASGNDILLTARRTIDTFTVLVNSGETTNDLTVTKTTTATPATIIPLGVFVSRASGWREGLCRLPVSGDRLIGITCLNRQLERIGVGEGADEGYIQDAKMDVLTKTASNKAIWVRCVESNLTEDDLTVYVSHAAGTQGFVTRSDTNSINATTSVGVKIEGNSIWSDLNGCYIVPISVSR
jgi:hypothetical protein